ncbi:unnamed protein product [Caenorhabditis sp. 36 PRJEB53466]|nr:unnamed protein product [Caenorhabditis sp. 36 PRJEB53466]
MESDRHNFTDPLNLVASLIMIVVGVFGVGCNLAVVYIFIRAPTERTSFNLICVYRGFANTLILGWAFVGTFVPMALFGDTFFSPLYQTLVIGIANSAYAGIQWTGVLIAVNRFAAIFFPKLYFTMFSVKMTFVISTAIFAQRVYRITMQFIQFIPIECFMTFSITDLTWYPNMEEKCDEDSTEVINSSLLYLVIIIVLNLCTLVKLYHFYKNTMLEADRVQIKMRKNRIMFLQTLIQDSIQLVDMIFTYRLSLLSSERYWTFISGSLIWEIVHSSDGFIMIMFNERLTFLKRSLFSSSAHPSNQNSMMFVSTIPSRAGPQQLSFPKKKKRRIFPFTRDR